jgi:hypothetical protein
MVSLIFWLRCKEAAMRKRDFAGGKFVPVVDQNRPERELGKVWLPAAVIAHIENINGVTFPVMEKGGIGQFTLSLKWRTIEFEAEPGAPGWKRGKLRDRVVAYPPSELHHLHRIAGEAWRPSEGLDG